MFLKLSSFKFDLRQILQIDQSATYLPLTLGICIKMQVKSRHKYLRTIGVFSNFQIHLFLEK